MADSLHIWHCGAFHFKQKRPLVMGVLNLTPDSFSDGGQFSNSTDALRYAYALLEEGADIIEVGGESTRPGSKELAPREELSRVLPVVEALAKEGVCVSLDSRHPLAVHACLDAGAAIINDITGFTSPDMQVLATQSKAGCVIMHMQGQPQTMQDNPQYTDVVEEVSGFLLSQARLLGSLGVEADRICLDPGPGFGKDYEQNLALLQSTAHFAQLGLPPYLLMAAWSRKRFIGQITGEETPSKRVAGSVAAALFAAQQGAGVLRVHDVAPTVEALKIWEVLL